MIVHKQLLYMHILAYFCINLLNLVYTQNQSGICIDKTTFLCNFVPHK